MAYEESLETITSYILETEYEFIVDEIMNHNSFKEWADFIIHETVYGAAKVVEYRNASDSEMMRDLRGIWDNEKSDIA
jgi:hypothetical protein